MTDRTMTNPEPIAGYEGSVGPFRNQHRAPHVYARDIHSGAGNCRCGGAPGDWIHTEIAPGVPVPDVYRHGTSCGETYAQGRTFTCIKPTGHPPVAGHLGTADGLFLRWLDEADPRVGE